MPPSSAPASEILWWGHGKVLVDASLTKGGRFAAFTRMQSIIAGCPSVTSVALLKHQFTLPRHLGTIGLGTVNFQVTLYVIPPTSFYLIKCRFHSPTTHTSPFPASFFFFFKSRNVGSNQGRSQGL